MYDRGDFEELRKRKPKVNGQHLEYLAQAEMMMQNLTGDQYWDRFLSYIQSALDGMKANLSGMEEALCSPSMVDPNEIMAAKLAIAAVGGRIESLEAVLALPKDIMETGERAREKLKSLAE